MSSEPKQLMVGKIKRTTTETGKPVVEMWSADTRLKFPELRLFDLGMLLDVGIDPNSLDDGEELVVRLKATYVESDKTNQRGNPYKDVQFLERANGHAPAPSADGEILGEILAELQAIRALLERRGIDVVAPGSEELREVKIVTPEGQADEPPPPEEAPDLPPLSEDEAKRKFYTLASPSIQAGRIDAVDVNELANAGKQKGWRDALVALEKALL